MSIKVVIDTNIWVSFLFGQSLSSLVENISKLEVILLMSDSLVEELVEVLNRPKFAKYFPKENVQELLSLIQSKANWVETSEEITACRDPKDNFLLDLCVSGNADYLITGDSDLLVLNPFEKTQIISYKSFEKLLSKF